MLMLLSLCYWKYIKCISRKSVLKTPILFWQFNQSKKIEIKYINQWEKLLGFGYLFC